MFNKNKIMGCAPLPKNKNKDIKETDGSISIPLAHNRFPLLKIRSNQENSNSMPKKLIAITEVKSFLECSNSLLF